MGDSRNLGSLLLMCFHAAKHGKVWDHIYVKLLESSATLINLLNKLYTEYHISYYLEYVSLEDVVPHFHSLLPVELSLLSGEHECQESVAAPVRFTNKKQDTLPKVVIK